MPRTVLKKSMGGALLAAFMLTSSVEHANADAGKALLGIGIGVAIGCASGALNCKGNRQRQTTQRRAPAPKPAMSAEQRQANRNMQSALNAFGFNAGVVDGLPGRQTRSAVNDYQRYMGYAQTGQLSDWERQTLLDSWQRLEAGAGNAYPRTMAAVGPRGLLNTARDPNYPAQFGDPVGPNYGSTAQTGYNNGNGGYNTGGAQTGTQNLQNPVVVPNQGGQTYDQTAGTTPVPVPPLPQGGQVVGAGAPKLKPLKPIGAIAISAAARCELVDQTTRIQGGVIQAANMTDSNQALSEKFCEARGFAITQGQSVASQFAVSEDELSGTCGQIEEAFADAMSALPESQPEQVMASAQSAAQELGLSDPATAATYGQICLGIGYRLDNAEMALAGALTMVSAGEAPYGEIIGHHIREGFGVAANQSAATPWYQDAVSALEQGANPAFVPSTTQERIQVIQAALQMQEQRANWNNGSGGSLPRIVPASNVLPVLQPVNK